jgi:mannose-6-phosphate isomerase-like protein (cupin superfamily)
VTFPGDRRILTRFGPLDVFVRLREDGTVAARLAKGSPPELAALGGAIGDTEVEAVALLAEMVEVSHVPLPVAVVDEPRPLVVSLEALLTEQDRVSYREFLRVPALSLGLFTVRPGHGDRQEPHREDEVYVVVAGQAILEVDGVRSAVGPGSVAYVPASAPHHFSEITSDLRVIVVFSPPLTV